MSRYFATDPTVIRLSVSALVWRGDPPVRELLLMRRSDNGHWGLPGGYVEAGESVTDAVAREVYEETGVEIEVGRLVGVYSDPKRQVIEYAPEETLELGYFPPEALPSPFVPIHTIRIEDAVAGGVPSVR